MLLLAACAPRSEPEQAPLRDPNVAVASQADATIARLSGRWLIVSGAGVTPGSPVTIAPDRMVLGDRGAPIAQVGPGRLLYGDTEIWVHWLDADNRTAAMGAVDGGPVWIMDRTGRPGERLRAARDILDWYGYDLAQLEGI